MLDARFLHLYFCQSLKFKQAAVRSLCGSWASCIFMSKCIH